MKIVYTTNDDYLVHGTPAAVSEDGVLYINTTLFYQLTPFQREFIKWHEVGHYRLQTHDEKEADAFAFRKMAGKYPRSLKQMIGTLETILDPDVNEGVAERMDALYRLCLEYDANCGNQRAADELYRIGTTVWRGDGTQDAKREKARSEANVDLIEAMAAANVAQRGAESKDDSQNQMMTYLLIGVLLLVLLK